MLPLADSLSGHHSDQMYERSHNSEVTLCAFDIEMPGQLKSIFCTLPHSFRWATLSVCFWPNSFEKKQKSCFLFCTEREKAFNSAPDVRRSKIHRVLGRDAKTTDSKQERKQNISTFSSIWKTPLSLLPKKVLQMCRGSSVQVKILSVHTSPL